MRYSNKKFLAAFFIQLIIFLPIVFSLEISSQQAIAGTTSATITWTTDEAADSRVRYGKTTSYEIATIPVENEVTQHSIGLSSLSAATKYYYEIRSVNSNSAPVYEVGSFSTKDNIPPNKVANLHNGSVSTTSLYLYWDPTGDADIDKYIIYRDGSQIGVASHPMTSYYATGLSQRTQYSFYVVANDTSGNKGTKSDTLTITTKDSTPPLKITGVKTGLISNTSIGLLWDRNGESDFKEYAILRNNVEIKKTASNSYTDTGLKPDTKYDYAIYAVDDSGNKGEKSNTLTAYTKSTASGEFEITNVQFTNSQMIWETNDLSNSTISYGTTPSALDTTIAIDEQTKMHTITLSDIVDGDTYYYIIESCTLSECKKTSRSSFIAGYSSEIPEINANIPSFYNSRRININGTTKPQSSVQLYVNNVLKGSYPNTGLDGLFKFSSVQLDDSNPENLIRIFVKDYLGQNNTKEYTISLDTKTLLLDVNLPKASASANLNINGSVNKKSTIKIYVLDATDKVPAKVENLTLNSQGNLIRLSWTQVNNTDKYIIYRSDVGVLATSSTPAYSDSKINISKSYTYTISAMDRSCREGEKSESLSTTSQSTINNDLSTTPESAICSLTPQRTLNEITGQFQTSISLKEGNNLVRIEAIDVSSAMTELEQTILYDTRQVQITSPSDLSAYSPVYQPEIKFSGSVNKQATLNVYLDKSKNPSQTIITDENGAFTVKIDLENYNTDKSNDTAIIKTYNDPTASRTTHIELEAVDYLGQKSNRVSGDIDYAVCAYGYWWKINSTKPMPDVLTPSLLVQGLAQVGISYEIAWQGGPQNHTFMNANVRLRPLSPKERLNWDSDWVSGKPSVQGSYDNKQGYVTISLKAKDPFPGDKTRTDLEREQNISKHRYTDKITVPSASDSLDLDQYYCSTPKTGCIKIPLIMEVKFREGTETKIQRQCWNFELQTDVRADPSLLSKRFLTDAVNFLNSSVELIDSVLEPINKIMPYVFYGCVGSMALNYIWALRDGFMAWTDKFDKADGKPVLDLRVAQQGRDACKAVYDPDVNPAALTGNEKADVKTVYDDCIKQVDRIQSRKDYEYWSNMLCDRIFSPAVPTFQKYVKDQQKTSPIITVTIGDSGSGKLNTASVCNGLGTALEYDMDESTQVVTSKVVGSSGSVGAQKVINIYNLASKSESNINIKVNTKEDPQKTLSLKEYCQDNMPYSGLSDLDSTLDNDITKRELCCFYQYDKEWSVGCPMMDIGKESACLAAEAGNINVASGDDAISCNSIINAAAGVCEVAGKAKPEMVNSNEKINKASKTSTVEDCIGIPPEQLKNEYLYFFISKPNSESNQYEVTAGAVIDNYDLEISEDTKKTLDTNPDLVSIQASTKLKKGHSFTNYFSEENIKTYTETKKAPPEFNTELGKCIGRTGTYDSVYGRVLDKIGMPDKQYIADPSASLIRSVQCISLPSIKGHLELWRNILAAARDCFQQLLVTGEGSAGVCKAFFSVYLCDIIYDLLSCFTEKYGAGPGGSSSAGSVGSIFTALTSAGSSVTSSVTSRYGDSNTFDILFGQKKLVHAVCLFAFTGDWSFDMTAALESTYNVPTESISMVSSATRRYQSFNPVAQSGGSSGLTKYSYDIAAMLFAGSDISYTVKICCSTDYSCKDADYDSSGKCDCASGSTTSGLGLPTTTNFAGETCLDMTSQFGTGQLKRGESLNKEVQFMLEGIQHKQRYDLVKLEYAYLDLKNAPKEPPKPATLHIGLAGGTPPAYCQFYADTLSYQCRLNFDNENWVRLEDPSVQPSYEINENIEIGVDVVNKEPKDYSCTGKQNCQNTKYLTMSIIDPTNNRPIVVEGESNVIRINGNDRYHYTLPGDFGKQIAITANDVTGGSLTSGYTIYYANMGLTVTPTKDSNPTFNTGKFGIKFVSDTSYILCPDPQEKPTGTASTTKDFDMSACTSPVLPLPADKIIEYRGAKISIVATSRAGKYVVIDYTRPQATCVGSKTFNGIIKVYSSKEVRGSAGTYQMSSTPTMYQGIENKKNFTFTVPCPTTSQSANQFTSSLTNLNNNYLDLKFTPGKGAEISKITLCQSDKDKKNEVCDDAKSKTDDNELNGGDVTFEINPPTPDLVHYRAFLQSTNTGAVSYSNYVPIVSAN